MGSKNRKSQKKSYTEKRQMSIRPYLQNNKEQRKMNSGNANDKPDIHAQGPRDVEKEFHIYLKGQHEPIVLKHSEKNTLYGALQHVNALQADMETWSGKEMLVCGMKGIDAYIHPAMPLSCFPEVTHLEISFNKSQNEQKENNPLFGLSHKFGTAAVKFYIHALGKTEGEIVRCRKLYKEKKFCVFGFRGETVKKALCRDGRFLPCLENSVWKLTEKPECTVDSSQLVDDLEGKVFELEFEQRLSSGVASAQNSESEGGNPGARIGTSLRGEGDKNREHLEKEMKRANDNTMLFEFYEYTSAILKKIKISFSVLNQLINVSKSVGYLCWNNKGNIGSATCFVFSHQFIFTCWHVIRDIVGPGTGTNEWGRIVSGCATVSFVHEEGTEKGEDLFFFDPWFEVGDRTLDYAVLKLKTKDRIQAPSGLYKGLPPAVDSDFMFIIGHPEGMQKPMGFCFLMPQSQRERIFQAWLAQLPSYSESTRKSFQKITDDDDVITYYTSFHFGASGSPLFNPEGLLVGMHAAGLSAYLRVNDASTIRSIECGPSMRAILSHIKQNFPQCYSDMFSSQEQEMLSVEY